MFSYTHSTQQYNLFKLFSQLHVSWLKLHCLLESCPSIELEMTSVDWLLNPLTPIDTYWLLNPLTPIDTYWRHYDWPFIWTLRAVKWPSTSNQKMTRFSHGTAANKQPWGVIKRGYSPLLNTGVRRVQHPLNFVTTTFFEVGRRPETSLVDIWQPTPPEETQITGAPCVTL